MGFKSEAQRKFFAAKLGRGEMTKQEFDEWQSKTPAKLPERVAKKQKIRTVKEVKKVRSYK